MIQRRAPSGPVLADQIIRLNSPQGQAGYPELLRRVHYRDPETGQEYTFLTNRLDLVALEVAELWPPLADRTLFQVDQAKLEDQGLLWNLQECRAHPNLDHLDRLRAPGLAQVQEQGGLETSGTYPPGSNYADGTL